MRRLALVLLGLTTLVSCGRASAPSSADAGAPEATSALPFTRATAHTTVRDPGTSTGAVRVDGERGWIEIRALDVAPAAAHRLPHGLRFAAVAAEMDLERVSVPDGFEELRTLHRPRAVTLRYELRLGPSVAIARVREGRVELVDDRGVLVLGSAPMWMRDADGVQRDLVPELERHGDVATVTVHADARALRAPIVIDPLWSTVGSMAFAGSTRRLVRLQSGKVLGVGGMNTNSSTSGAEVYDPATLQWTSVGSMSQPRSGPEAWVMTSGKVLVSGGGADGRVDVFDPGSQTFTVDTRLPDAFVIPVDLGSGTAALFDRFTGGAFVWDEVAGTASTIVYPNLPRAAFAAAKLPNGKVLVAGGQSNENQRLLASVEIFDPATKTWSDGPALSSPRQWMTLIAIPGTNKLAAIGGAKSFSITGSANTTEIFDPTANTWSPGLTMTRGWDEQPGTNKIQALSNGRLLRPGAALVADVFAQLDFVKGVELPITLGTSNQQLTSVVVLSGTQAIACGGFTGTGAVTAACQLLALQPDGATCDAATPGDCVSGFCADGVCCDAACTGACVSCKVTSKVGTCSPLTGAPKTAESCAPWGTCNAGTCVTSSCASDTTCAPSSFCDTGACKPKRVKGASCTAATQCASGRCVDDVCCDSACTGQCEACNLGGKEGTCSAVTGQPASGRAACSDTKAECGQVCDGKTRSSCVYLPAGSSPCGKNSCESATETHAATCNGAGACGDAPKACGAYACGVDACRSACSSNVDCAAGYICAQDPTPACVPAPGLGEACTSAASCATGFCVDGVCCGVASCGAGSTCAAPGKAGTCAKTDGIACKADGECVSGICVDGVCCAARCDGQCEACDVPGQAGKCTPVTGAPRGMRAACDTAADACAIKSCDGTERTSCKRPAGSETVCRKAACKDGIATVAARCGGTGACPAAETTPCNGFACDPSGTECLVICTQASDCATGFQCEAGTCRTQVDRCSDDGTAKITSTGETLSCGHHRCKAGICPTSCVTSDECIAGYACADSACVSAVAPADDGGSCTMNARRRTTSSTTMGGLFLLATVAIALRRRAAIVASVAALGCGSNTNNPPPAKTGEADAVLALTAPVHARLRPRGGARLDVTMPNAADDATVLRHGDAWLAVKPLGLAHEPAEIRDGALVFAHAAPHVDVSLHRDPSSVEELRVLRDRGARQHVWTLRASEGLSFRLVARRVEAVDGSGHVRFQTAEIVALDARGVRLEPAVALTQTGAGARLTVTLDLDAAELPVVLDPAWTSPTSMNHGFAYGAAVTLNSGDVMTFHGWGTTGGGVQTWSSTTGLFTAGPLFLPGQQHATVVKLADGRVLVAGDQSSDSTGRRTQLFEPATGTYKAIAPMLQSRGDACGVLLSSGKALIMGGFLAFPNTFRSTAETYDAATDTWTNVAPMSKGRKDCEAVRLASGKVLVVGGQRSNAANSDAEIYDPTNNTWTPAGTMSEPREMLSLAQLADGKVLVVGGNASSSESSSSADLFDPATSTFSRLPDMPHRHGAAISGVLPSGRVLVVGGTPGVTAAEVFDPTTKSWLSGGSMLLDRMGAVAAKLNDGSIMILGGQSYLLGDYAFQVEVFKEQPNATPCQGDGECTSGHCADGVCCDAACDGACQACGESGNVGKCIGVSGAPRAAHPSCAPALTCAAGACATACATDAQCAATGFCSSGSCAAKRTNGQTCGRAEECASAHCTDGICCDTACDGQCESCAEPSKGGTCTAVTGAPRAGRPACAGTFVGGACGLSCLGQNGKACEYPSNVTACDTNACTAGVETHASVCDGVGRCNDVPKACGAFACGATTCNTTCTTLAECVAGFVCKSGACVPAPGLGQTCSAASPCPSALSCTDGVCCGVASCGSGESCGLPATKGRCAKSNGSACAVSAECGSGNCTDGVCCDTRCDGQCQACDVAGSVGTCAPIKGAPHGDRPACGSGASACEVTSCDGSDGSRCVAFVGSDVICRAAKCESGVAVAAARCTGTGSCPAEVTTACTPFACDATTCRTTCSEDLHCAPGHRCKSGACVRGTNRCSDDGLSVLDADDKPTSCAPLHCKDAKCLTTCADSTDCVAGFLCAEGRCTVPEAPAAAVEEGGCAMGARGARGTFAWSFALVALGLARRRRRAAATEGGGDARRLSTFAGHATGAGIGSTCLP